MAGKTEFHSFEFFRKVRDRQEGVLAGKSPAEIVAFFSKAQIEKSNRVLRRARPKAAGR